MSYGLVLVAGRDIGQIRRVCEQQADNDNEMFRPPDRTSPRLGAELNMSGPVGVLDGGPGMFEGGGDPASLHGNEGGSVLHRIDPQAGLDLTAWVSLLMQRSSTNPMFI